MKIIKKIKGYFFNKVIYKKIIPWLGNIEWVFPKYRIPKTRNLTLTNNAEHKNPFLSPNSYSYDLVYFLSEIGERLHKKNNFSLVRLGDSELFFLNGKIVGNMINRSFLKNKINKKELNIFKKKIYENDYVCEYKLFYMKKISPKWLKTYEHFHSNTIYASVSTKLLFYILKGYKVGLIGASPKIKLIKELMKNREYLEYLGINSFEEFIEIPQKGASKNINKTIKTIEKQMKCKCDIYLVGMSVLKIVTLPYLRDKYNSSFLDIGIGIDAIAGIVPNTKPYFGNWVNYRIKDYNYSDINFFNYMKGVKKQISNIKLLNIN